MLKYLLISLLLICSTYTTLVITAQTTIAVTDNFEGDGTITSWYGDDCAINTAFANPHIEGINSSATVLRYDDTGGQYANIGFDVPHNFDLSENSIFSLKIYVPSSSITGTQSNQVSLKLQNNGLDAPWSTQSEIIQPVVLDSWQTVNFDFASDDYINLDASSLPPIYRTDFNRVLIQVNGENNNDYVVAYIDDIAYNGTISDAPIMPETNFNYLVWADEFNEDGAIDDEKWFPQTLLPNGFSWYNNELQHYTNRIENAFIQDGALHINAIRGNFTDQGHTKEYTSARLNSKFAFQYGRVEVRAKLPTGVGTWPAIWMLGKNISEPGAYWEEEFGTTPWPACGEIDIMEHWGNNQNYISSAVHTPSSFGATENVGGLVIEGVSDNFHTYELEWTSERLTFSVDGNVHYIYQPDEYNADTWPFDHDMYFILNVAMINPVEPAFTQSAMEIDYIRVYQATPAVGIAPNTSTTGQILITPNPCKQIVNLQVPNSLLGATTAVYNIKGELMHTFTQEQVISTIDVSNFPAGLYLVKVATANGTITKKMIKQ